MVPPPPPQHGGRRASGVPPIQILPTGIFVDGCGHRGAGGRKKFKHSPKIINIESASRARDWLNKGRRRGHDSSEDDDDSIIFEGDERSSFAEDISDASDELNDRR